jgi:hypothetical protein
MKRSWRDYRDGDLCQLAAPAVFPLRRSKFSVGGREHGGGHREDSFFGTASGFQAQELG